MTDTTTPVDPEVELGRSMQALFLAADESVVRGHNAITTAALEKLRGAHKKTLDVLEALANAGRLQESCPHDAEPDFCDNCAVAREKQVSEAKKAARAHLRACGRRIDP